MPDLLWKSRWDRWVGLKRKTNLVKEKKKVKFRTKDTRENISTITSAYLSFCAILAARLTFLGIVIWNNRERSAHITGNWKRNERFLLPRFDCSYCQQLKTVLHAILSLFFCNFFCKFGKASWTSTRSNVIKLWSNLTLQCDSAKKPVSVQMIGLVMLALCMSLRDVYFAN